MVNIQYILAIFIIINVFFHFFMNQTNTLFS